MIFKIFSQKKLPFFLEVMLYLLQKWDHNIVVREKDANFFRRKSGKNRRKIVIITSAPGRTIEVRK
jgi:hypothetical protein